MVGVPFRFLRLADITKQVAAGIKADFEAKKASGGTGKGSGAVNTLKTFLPSYMKTNVIARTPPEDYRHLLKTSLSLLVDSFTAEAPYPFNPYHEAIRGPDIDLYKWGNDFFRPMVKFRSSRVEGKEHVTEISRHLAQGENVVLLANHQTEADPQVLSILMELEGQEPLAERCIFVAGHKVTTDPLAVPFSKGRNLLTIFSKKYLDSFEEEEKLVKAARNRETVFEMQRLMAEGGNIFWVAPSGGRDRRSLESGEFEPAKFDPASVGLFAILAQKAQKASGKKTHFYPLAMWTHGLMPPPEDTKSAVGESRSAARSPVGLEFGAELDIDALGGRKKFPAGAERMVQEQYAHLNSLMKR